MSTRLALIVSLLAVAAHADAQPISIDQVSPSSARLGVEQISPNALDRTPSTTSPLTQPRAATGDPSLSSRTSRKDSIDAEEIARVLGAGQANTIDAAAALASGAVAIDTANAPPTPPSDTEQEPSARASVEPRAR